MDVHYDQLRRSDAAGNTCDVTFTSVSGSATVSTSYPITNLYDETSTNSKNESFYLSKFTEISFTASDTFAIRIDLGAAQSVSFGLLSGVELKKDDTSTITSITLEHSDDDAAWTTFQTITRQIDTANQWDDLWSTIGTPQVAFTNTAASHRYWRYKFIIGGTAVSNFIRVGYASVYGDGYDLGISNPNINQVSMNGQSIGKTGTPFVVSNGQYRMFPVNLPNQNGDLVAFVNMISRGAVANLADVQGKVLDGTITSTFVDPSNWPTIGLFHFGITDSNSDSQTIKRSLFSCMCVVDRSVDWSFNYHSLNPNTGLTLREWV